MKVIVGIFIIFSTALLLFWWKTSFALPLFCTTHGCVTNRELQKEKVYQTAFASVVGSSASSEPALLTTLVRKHLLLTANSSSTIHEDAIKYRTNVLHFTDQGQLKKLGFQSFEEYDNAVTVPFILQQAYMNEHSLKDPREAYILLSQNFRVISLLFHYTWDSSKGEVVAR